MKKLLSVFFTAVTLFVSLSITSYSVKSVEIEQVNVYIPEIVVGIRTDLEKDESVSLNDISSKLDDDSLDGSGYVKFDKSKQSSTVYFLVDTSRSVRNPYLEEVKKKIIDFNNKKSEKQNIILITFGNTVKVLLDGSVKDKKKIESAVNTITTEDSETCFFDAIKKAVEIQQSKKDDSSFRSYAIVYSDGDNDSTSGGSTKKEVEDRICDHSLPVYGISLGVSDQSLTSEFGEICRKSGGKIETVNNPSDISVATDKVFKSADSVYFLTLSPEDNKSYVGKEKTLLISVKDKFAEKVKINFSSWRKDYSNPTVKSIVSEVENGKEKLTVYFSEDVFNADNPENFIVKRKNSEFRFTDAQYSNKDNEYYAVLKSEKLIPSHDDYEFVISNVTDRSGDKNPVDTENKTFTVGKYSGSVCFLYSFWYIIAAVLVLALVALLIILNKKNKQPEPEALPATQSVAPVSPCVIDTVQVLQPQIQNEKHHVLSPNGKNIMFKIDDGRSQIRTLNTVIYKDLTFGRSDQCDIFFDDMKMSRLHFKIECVNDELFIKDLNSQNGTILNNIRILEKRKLTTNDVIQAGQHIIIVIF